MGSIFRTADAAGVSKIYLSGITPIPPHEKISKTALGAENVVPWEHVAQSWRLVEKLKKSGHIVVALEQSGDSKNIFDFKPGFPLALIVGNEVNGVNKNLFKYCDHILEIPMLGQKESLNVSVATGIALFEIINK